MDPAAARRAALADIGGLDRVKAAVREGRIGHGVETTMQEVRFAWRGLRRSPCFAAVAIVTLALGIGANTAIFSVVRAMLLAPLPFRDSSQLVFVWADMTTSGYPRAPLSGPELKDLGDRSTLFSGFGAIWATTAALTGDGDPEQLRIALVTTNFFSVLGADARPARGRAARRGRAGVRARLRGGRGAFSRRAAVRGVPSRRRQLRLGGSGDGAAALAACWLPARRASVISPLDAIRTE
jgi:hypothetical protein